MKVALLCDWLTMFGGAEQVLLELHKMYPEAPIYTSQYRELAQFKGAKVYTAGWDWLPARWRNYLTPLRVRYFRNLDLSQYDLVISSAMAEAKAVRAKRHICYINGVPRYYWSGAKTGRKLVDLVVGCFRGRLARMDYLAAQRPTLLVANSSSTAKLVKKHYKRPSEVVFPPVPPLPSPAKLPTREPYYLCLARQEAWKNIDVAVEACLRLERPLVLVGDGREHKRLQKLAAGSDLVTFVTGASRAEICAYLQGARALIQASDETFGIAAAEALSVGTPVVALRVGGALDYVEDGVNGVFFLQPTVSSLVKALICLEGLDLDFRRVVGSAKGFGPGVFERAVKRLVDKG
ncbi:glycosyltransferase [Candidatus Saccharibacteria bacterium]|nr:glycosyltransferase [Candidatus Saccharibacteria bacterium]